MVQLEKGMTTSMFLPRANHFEAIVLQGSRGLAPTKE